MAVCVEQYVLLNFTINAVTIAVLARSLGRIDWKGVLFAAAFGALYAVAMHTRTFAILGYLPCKAVLACAITLLALRVDGPKALMRGVALLVTGTALVGGAMRLTVNLLGSHSIWSMGLGAVLGWAALIAALEARSRKLDSFRAQIILRKGGHTVRVEALVDTGNRLREPLSGLPVLVVESTLVTKLLPDTLDAERPDHTLPPGFRLVAYGALGGQGHMACFLPDDMSVCYGAGWMRAPDVWIAVYPGEIPGAAQAIAPPILGRVRGERTSEAIKHGEERRQLWLIQRDRR